MSPGRIEFRHHNRYSDERVKGIAKAMLNLPDLAFAREFTIIYQGRIFIDRGKCTIGYLWEVYTMSGQNQFLLYTAQMLLSESRSFSKTKPSG